MTRHHLYDDATQHNPVEKVPAFSHILFSVGCGRSEIRHSQGTLIAQQLELTPGFRS